MKNKKRKTEVEWWPEWRRTYFDNNKLIREPKELNWPVDFKNSFQHPIFSAPIHQLVRNANRVVIIVSDYTRKVPTNEVMPFILDELDIAGISLEQVFVVVATGLHRPSSKNELDEIIGREYVNKLEIINHDAFDKDKLVYLGTTSLGTPVEVNKMVYDADFRIIVGKIASHPFAGFSGGRKSVLPGITSEKTTNINHGMLFKNCNQMYGQIENNPADKDMCEAAKMLGIHFNINFVLNINGRTIGLFTGDLFESHKKAVEFINSFCKVN